MLQAQQKSPRAAPQQPRHPQSGANEYDDLQDYDLPPPLPTC